MTRGRFREFHQCDFDVAGVYPSMVPDAEVIKVLTEILDDLDLGAYEIKLNHRGLLDSMLDIAGVPEDKFRPICSAIDKLDKEPWEVVRREMVVDKGLDEAAADAIRPFVELRGQPKALLATLLEPGHAFSAHPRGRAALEELRTLFDFLGSMGALDSIVFDLSLARGLDYYTGVIYEAVLKGAVVGSIAAGGRYDKLVGMFSGKDVPAVGVSIGIERIYNIMEEQARRQAQEEGCSVRETETQVLVASIGNGHQAQRMQLAARLWARGIKVSRGWAVDSEAWFVRVVSALFSCVSGDMTGALHCYGHMSARAPHHALLARSLIICIEQRQIPTHSTPIPPPKHTPKAEFGYKSNPKMDYQLGYALKQGIDLVVLFGESVLQQVRDRGDKLHAWWCTRAFDLLLLVLLVPASRAPFPGQSTTLPPTHKPTQNPRSLAGRVQAEKPGRKHGGDRAPGQARGHGARDAGRHACPPGHFHIQFRQAADGRDQEPEDRGVGGRPRLASFPIVCCGHNPIMISEARIGALPGRAGGGVDRGRSHWTPSCRSLETAFGGHGPPRSLQ